jgi:transposase-like protein
MAKKQTGKHQRNKTKSRPLSAQLQARHEKRRIATEAVREGATVESVARMLKVSLRTVFRWLARYRMGGQHALQEGHRSGRPPKVDAELMRWSTMRSPDTIPGNTIFPSICGLSGWCGFC